MEKPNTRKLKIGDAAEYAVRPECKIWVPCVIGEKELQEIESGYGFFEYRHPVKKNTCTPCEPVPDDHTYDCAEYMTGNGLIDHQN